MTSVLKCSSLLIIWNLLACVNGGTFVEPSPSTSSIISSAEGETRLPCRFQVSEGEVLVQVTWIWENEGGSKEQIITAHPDDGQLVSSSYTGRVRFESSDPIADSSLIIMNTQVMDEGTYTCTVATFPSGKSDVYITLTVHTIPIASLDPFILVEGESFRAAAVCRSVARPQATLSWDTDLPGSVQSRNMDPGVTSTTFSLHPLRSMNGRKLDCVVTHPTLKSPRRLSNQLVVHYHPYAAITGFDQNWYVGLNGPKLQCDAGGNPKPDRFNWTRKNGVLPEGVTIKNEFLQFNRPLQITDQGTYECVASNSVGSGRADVEITIAESPQGRTSVDSLLLIIIGSAAGVLVLVLVIIVMSVNRYHKRKNKQLTMELIERKEEICSLSRQASIRRVGSDCTDNKYQICQMDEIMPLRVEGTLRTSLSSLERPRSRDSRSTIGGLGTDALGRPAIFNTSRRGRERSVDRDRDSEREATRLKVESFVRNSNLSLIHPEGHFYPALQPAPFPLDQTIERVRSRNGIAIVPADGRPHSGGGSRAGSRGPQSSLSSTYPALTDEEEGDISPIDEDSGVPCGLAEENGLDNGGSETTSSQISEAMSSHFEHTNGTLWPKSKPNNILLSPEPTRMSSSHASIIHHQPQIV